jgi:hypothetical protein
MSGPPNKWYSLKISITSDVSALTSTEVLAELNSTYPVTAAFTATCSDGTFAFIGVYSD